MQVTLLKRMLCIIGEGTCECEFLAAYAYLESRKAL